MDKEDMPKPIRSTPKVRAAAVNERPVAEASNESKRRINSPARLIDNVRSGLSPTSKTILLMVGAFLAGSLLTFTVVSNSEPKVDTLAATFSEISSGRVALSEAELVNAVKELGVDVYWAGPVDGAKYTVSAPADGQVYIRYLPNGEGLNDTKANYVVIATYATPDAFTSTQSAGNQTNGVTFINTQGGAVFYSKDAPTNVYVAYPNIDFQIEVFSPIAKTALDIASKQGALRLVK
jgi:hypothetical protein